MKIIEIRKAKQWKNTKTGQTASVYGSCPWLNDNEKKQWSMIDVGYTWVTSNGSVGIGRKPAKTYSEAVEVMEAINNR